MASEITKDDVERLLAKYEGKLGTQLQGGVTEETASMPQAAMSKEYLEFMDELRPNHINWYEKACNFCANLLKTKVKKERYDTLMEQIDICHLNTTPEGIEALSLLGPLAYILVGAFLSFVLFNSSFFAFFFIITGAATILPLKKVPKMMADKWRMKASNQMVLCVFYIVTYMRQTSNLEGAINFAGDHLGPPLAVDMKKVVWNMETGKYASIKESLDMYLESWRKYNLEFIEAIHLIESSLFEGSDERRMVLLDKSLDVILSETYEKMLRFAHNLKGPITMLHMMGVILPILGLVILPLVVTFMGGVHWYHIAVLYNIIIPVAVLYMGTSALANRPSGYGEADITGKNPELKKYQNFIIKLGKTELKITPALFSIIFITVLFLIALSPVVIGSLSSPEALLKEKEIIKGTGFKFLEYREASDDPSQLLGPYGLGAAVLSLLFPIAIGVGIGTYFTVRSRKLIKFREESKKLESEFSSALFQLGNRLGDGMPAEATFGKVAEIMHGTASGKFFEMVDGNITRLGMSVEQAIFNKKTGALQFFPSEIIESSMRILVSAVKKGPKIAAQALLNISRYIKEIHRVDQRLKDLMADIISSMKSQIGFMAPAISGIVIGITSMITTIMGRLKEQAASMAEGGRGSMVQDLFGDAIPTYYFQLVVGIYVVEIIIILTVLTNTIENGSDKLNEEHMLGHNMKRSTLLYCAIALIVMLIFNMIASKVVGAEI